MRVVWLHLPVIIRNWLSQQPFLMITFTPLSGSSRSSTTTPLSYLLQIDDVRILIDCGSPDWCPELSPFDKSATENEDQPPAWSGYTESLQKFVLSVASKSPYINSSILDLPRLLTWSFSLMVTWHIADYIPGHIHDGASKLLLIPPFQSKPWDGSL